MNVPTTEWKSSTIQISTRPSSAPATLSRMARHASTLSIAHLHTAKVNCRSSSSRSLISTWTFTCSISRLSGVRTVRTTMIVKFACMRTTGRTIDAALLCFYTVARCVRSGRSIILSALTRRAAQISINVCTLTAGKNKSTILTSSR